MTPVEDQEELREQYRRDRETHPDWYFEPPSSSRDCGTLVIYGWTLAGLGLVAWSLVTYLQTQAIRMTFAMSLFAQFSVLGPLIDVTTFRSQYWDMRTRWSSAPLFAVAIVTYLTNSLCLPLVDLGHWYLLYQHLVPFMGFLFFMMWWYPMRGFSILDPRVTIVLLGTAMLFHSSLLMFSSAIWEYTLVRSELIETNSKALVVANALAPIVQFLPLAALRTNRVVLRMHESGVISRARAGTFIPLPDDVWQRMVHELRA
jgi:hypothetical protein